MYPYYNTGRVYTNSSSFPITLNPNNKGVLIMPDTTGSPDGGYDVNLTFMSPTGDPGNGAVFLDGSLASDGSNSGSPPYLIPITVHTLAGINADAQVVELF